MNDMEDCYDNIIMSYKDRLSFISPKPWSCLVWTMVVIYTQWLTIALSKQARTVPVSCMAVTLKTSFCVKTFLLTNVQGVVLALVNVFRGETVCFITRITSCPLTFITSPLYNFGNMPARWANRFNTRQNLAIYPLVQLVRYFQYTMNIYDRR